MQKTSSFLLKDAVIQVAAALRNVPQLLYCYAFPFAVNQRRPRSYIRSYTSSSLCWEIFLLFCSSISVSTADTSHLPRTMMKNSCCPEFSLFIGFESYPFLLRKEHSTVHYTSMTHPRMIQYTVTFLPSSLFLCVSFSSGGSIIGPEPSLAGNARKWGKGGRNSWKWPVFRP